jgi:tetratricopeptide (TPR) repeat protein
MKSLLKLQLFFTVFLTAAVLSGADYNQLVQEASKLARAKDDAAAEAKYAEAMQSARTSAQKCKAVEGKYQAMVRQKKWKGSEAFMTAEIEEDEMLRPRELRRLVNIFAGTYLWSGRADFAMSLLQQALSLPCPTYSNEFYCTYDYMAHLYLHRKLPQPAIEVMRNVLRVRDLHPANAHGAHMLTARAYEMLGRKEDALRHYRAALEFGKKVQYKFDYSTAEKAIRRLSK